MFSLMVSFRRARARRGTAYGTKYWLFVATCMLGRGCGTTFADFEFGEVGTVVSLLSLLTFFVKKELEQGQRGLSHVHKLGFVLLFFFFFFFKKKKRTERGGRIKSLTLPLASEVVSPKEDFFSYVVCIFRRCAFLGVSLHRQRVRLVT